MNTEELNKFHRNIEVHIEVMVTDDMRAHACASKDHDLDFQVFRLLSGYRDALSELIGLKEELAGEDI